MFQSKSYICLLILATTLMGVNSCKPPIESARESAQMAIDYQKAGRYAESIQSAEAALKIYEQEQNVAVSDWVSVFYCLGFSNEKLGNLELAETYYRRSAEVSGINPTDRASILERLGSLQLRLGQQERATDSYREALRAMESSLGIDHVSTQAQRRALADFLIKIRNYSGAALLYSQLMKLHEETHGANSLEVADDLQELAAIRLLEGEYLDVEALLAKALDIYEGVLGENHILLAPILKDLAASFEKRGAYALAEKLYQRVISVLKARLDENHPDVATAMHALGQLHQKMGFYASADSLFAQALEIKKGAIGIQHLDVATILYDVARLDRMIGRYEKAETTFNAILPILSADHPVLSEINRNLGGLFERTGDFEAAENSYLQALHANQQMGRPFYPDIASNLSDLARLYQNYGLFNQAESLYCLLIERVGSTPGVDSSETIANMDDLATLYFTVGDYSKADSLYKVILNNRSDTFDPMHPSVATTLSHLARLHRVIGDFAAADSFSTQAERIRGLNSTNRQTGIIVQRGNTRAHIERSLPKARTEAEKSFFVYRSMLPGLPPERQENFISENRAIPNYWPSVCLIDSLRSNQIVSFTYYLALNGKRLAFEALGNHYANERAFEDIKSTKDSIEASFEFLTNLATSTRLDQQSVAQLNIVVDSVKSKRRFLDNRLAALEHLTKLRSEAVGVEQIAAVLPEDYALVDILFFTPPQTQNAEENSRTSYYLAFVVHRDSTPAVINLGEAQLIHESITQFRELVSRSPRSNVTTVATKTDQYEATQICHNLWMQLFRPLLPALGGKKNILINPDGQLNLIPFNIFIDDSSRFLIEKYRFHTLTNTRDMLLWNRAPLTNSTKAVVIADPDYDLELPTTSSPGTSRAQNSAKPHKSSFGSGTNEFTPLPNTGIEAMVIDTILTGRGFTTQLLMKQNARELALQSIVSPRVLHIASHGFFYSIAKPVQFSLGLPIASAGSEAGLMSLIENPLSRCGIALSGANRTRKAEFGENGKAMAAELIGMDLTGTDLVVLSACLSGYGEEVIEHEGVYGLFRSFLLAGAKTVLASLWSVPDLETKDLMIEFYRRYLFGENISKSEALRQAQLAMIEQLREKRDVAHPAYWGAFVSIGEP